MGSKQGKVSTAESIAILVVGGLVLVALVLKTDLGFFVRVPIAAACGTVAAGVTHAYVNRRSA